MRWACLLAVLVIAGPTPVSAQQAPELPPIPRLYGICLLTDAPGRTWASYPAPSLGVRLAHPGSWSAAHDERQRLVFTESGRLVLRAWIVDTGGQAPLTWLQVRQRSEEGRRCRAVILRGFAAHQCYDANAQAWTNLIALAHRVLAIEVPAALARDIHCGILMGLEPLAGR